MRWHPLDLLRLIFVALMAVIVIAGLTTSARPETLRQWTVVWLLVVFLAWVLLGFGWLRA
jgi:hypothetical protein